MQKLPSMILDDPGCSAIEFFKGLALGSLSLISSSMSLKLAKTGASTISKLSERSAEEESIRQNEYPHSFSPRSRLLRMTENALELLRVSQLSHVHYRLLSCVARCPEKSRRPFAEDIIPGSCRVILYHRALSTTIY